MNTEKKSGEIAPAMRPARKAPAKKNGAEGANPKTTRSAARPTGTVKTHFEFSDGKAKEVYLVGSFNGWEPHATPMKRGRDGTWTVDMELSPGRHEYRILADGQWRDDPTANAYERNPFGGRNAVVEVRA